MASIRLLLNGRSVLVEADPRTPLLSVLREELDLTGTKYGCGEGQCGACTVLLDGKAVAVLLDDGWHRSRGKKITTIEGLAEAAKTASGAAGVSGCRGRCSAPTARRG